MTKPDLFAILDSIDSTNNYAMQQVHAGLAKPGMAWFARTQTAGKGTFGKSWASEGDKNIAMSLVLEPAKIHITNPFHLNALVSLGCFDFFSTYAGIETSIKWPNDLYWRDRKAGGILIENVYQGKSWKWAVVGIGININQTRFDPLLPNPVSLKQITGKTFDPVEAARELYHLLIKRLLDPEAFEPVLKRYNENLFRLNKTVTLRKEGAKFETLVKGVSANGKLVTVDAFEREFDFGEVEWVL